VSRRHAASDDDSGALAAYLRAIAQVPLLTSDQERELGLRIRASNDAAAISRLVESNLRFVVCYARRYRHYGVSLLDLIHEGNLGLIEAARRFDPSRNVKFISYAVWWVREAMVHALAGQARAFSVPPKQLFALAAHADDVSLSEVRPDGARPIGDTLVQSRVPPADEALIHESELHELAVALDALDVREHEVVRLRYGLDDETPRTLQEIGDRLHLSRERVRQIESRAKDKLRRSARLVSRVN
jgi:RNA polymerase primary sigma factor